MVIVIKLSCQSNMAVSVYSVHQTWHKFTALILASVFGSAELSLKLLPSSLTQLGGTNNVNYKHYMDIWQSIDHQDVHHHQIRRSLPIRKKCFHILQVIAAEALKTTRLLPKLIRQAELALLRLQHHL